MHNVLNIIKAYAQTIKIVAVLCIFVVLALRMDWSMIENLTRNISISLTSIALLLIITQLLLLAYRWQIFMKVEK